MMRQKPNVWSELIRKPAFPVAVTLLIFCIWALIGLTESPGFMIDESPIIDAAHTFQQLGYLAVRASGPGIHHYEDAYLSQMPLHPVLLGVWFKVFGFGLWQGRLLSLILAFLVLCILRNSMRGFSTAAAVVAIILLAADPMFSERARVVRYDWVALVFGLLAWRRVALPTEGEGPLTPRRAAVLGLFVGIATSSHLLYGLCFGLTLGVLILVNEKLGRAVVLGAALLAGTIVALIPSFIYIRRHPGAWEGQLIFQIKTMGARAQSVDEWLRLQGIKHWNYFAKTPTWLVLGLVATFLAMVAWRRARREGDPVRAKVLRNLLISVGVMTIAVATGGGTWYLLVLAPFYAFLGGAMLDLARPGLERRVALGLLALTMLNLVSVSILGRTYSALQTWGIRDASKLNPPVSSLIPRGATVFGDRRLIFEAEKGGWTLYTDYEILPGDPAELVKIKYDFLALSDDLRKSPWLPMAHYQELATLQTSPSPFHLPSANNKAGQMIVHLYRRRRD